MESAITRSGGERQVSSQNLRTFCPSNTMSPRTCMAESKFPSTHLKAVGLSEGGRVPGSGLLGEKESAEEAVRDIRRKTRRRFSAEDYT